MLLSCARGSVVRFGAVRSLCSVSSLPKNLPRKRVSPFFTQVAPASTTAGVARGSYNEGEAYRQHSNVSHWTVDRIVDASLLPLLPVAFLTDSAIANYALIIAVGAHIHWGMESIVVDYARPRIVGTAFYYLCLGAVYAMSMATFAGLLYMNYNNQPPTKAIKKLWTL